MGNERLTFDNDAGVGANDEIIDVSPNAAVKDALKAALTPGAKPDGKPGGGKPTTDELLALNATPEGRAKVAAMFGIVNQEVVDDVIDIPNRAEVDALIAMTGGPEKFEENSEAFREAMALVGVDGSNCDALTEGLTAEEENREIAETIAEWREILGNPMKAQATLQRIYENPMQPPGRDYFMGRGSPELNDAIAKLWQATTGEPIVGRKKSKGDGWIK